MKHIAKSIVALAASGIFVLSSCSTDWLKPKPLSFLTPENAYVDADALYSALIASERNMCHEYIADIAPIMTEYYFSDLCVYGKTDVSGGLYDFDAACLPTTATNGDNNKIEWYWQEGFYAIKYANIVLSRVDNATYKSPEERAAVIGCALFQRDLRYYKLVHQFGNVPMIEAEISSPKTDFRSHNRWDILKQIVADMEFAYEVVPEGKDLGTTTKAGCGVLLMKAYMCLGEWDKAIKVGNEIVAAHPLVKEPLNGGKTVMEDLFTTATKVDPRNKENLLSIVSWPNFENCSKTHTLRNATAYWLHSSVKTPDGKTGTSNSAGMSPDDKLGIYDNDMNEGRGIGCLRPSNYFQGTYWGDESDPQKYPGLWDEEYNADDQRGPLYHTHGEDRTWTFMEDLYYNAKGLKGKSEYYGQHLQKPANMTVADSIRCWYRWPRYKLYIPDETITNDLKGGAAPMYIYRSAEVYLMLAECCYWKNDNANALANINVVRSRAGAKPLDKTLTIEDILSERARELYYEEPRHVELVRVAYTLAKFGLKNDYNGRQYNLETLCGPSENYVTDGLKEVGWNFWYDYVLGHNNFYKNNQPSGKAGNYDISVHHMLWPVPNNAITANTGAVLNQTPGYPGAEDNVEVLSWEVIDPASL